MRGSSEDFGSSGSSTHAAEGLGHARAVEVLTHGVTNSAQIAQCAEPINNAVLIEGGVQRQPDGTFVPTPGVAVPLIGLVPAPSTCPSRAISDADYEAAKQWIRHDPGALVTAYFQAPLSKARFDKQEDARAELVYLIPEALFSFS